VNQGCSVARQSSELVEAMGGRCPNTGWYIAVTMIATALIVWGLAFCCVAAFSISCQYRRKH
jgi:hypothetical protein